MPLYDLRKLMRPFARGLFLYIAILNVCHRVADKVWKVVHWPVKKSQEEIEQILFLTFYFVVITEVIK